MRTNASRCAPPGRSRWSGITGVAAGPNDRVARTLADADEDLDESKRARPSRATLTARLRSVIDRHDLASAERP